MHKKLPVIRFYSLTTTATTVIHEFDCNISHCITPFSLHLFSISDGESPPHVSWHDNATWNNCQQKFIGFYSIATKKMDMKKTGHKICWPRSFVLAPWVAKEFCPVLYKTPAFFDFLQLFLLRKVFAFLINMCGFP